MVSRPVTLPELPVRPSAIAFQRPSTRFWIVTLRLMAGRTVTLTWYFSPRIRFDGDTESATVDFTTVTFGSGFGLSSPPPGRVLP